jgi:hypothetical protein
VFAIVDVDQSSGVDGGEDEHTHSRFRLHWQYVFGNFPPLGSHEPGPGMYSHTRFVHVARPQALGRQSASCTQVATVVVVVMSSNFVICAINPPTKEENCNRRKIVSAAKIMVMVGPWAVKIYVVFNIFFGQSHVRKFGMSLCS